MPRCPGCGTPTTQHAASCTESEVSRSVHKAGVEFSEGRAASAVQTMAKAQEQIHQQHFGTGAVRDSNAGKGRPDLISPLALQRLAIVMQKGAEKYAERNWEKGIDLGRLMESTLRHLNQYLEGDRSEDHLGHAMFGTMALIHTEVMIERGLLDAKLDNLPRYVQTEITIKKG